MSGHELLNILLEDKPSESLREREEELFELLPELKKCKGFNQHSSWECHDVYEHTLRVVDNVPCNLILRLAALFHDIGMPDTCQVDENGIADFPGHWIISSNTFLSFIRRNGLSRALEMPVEFLISFHGLNGDKLPPQVLRYFGVDGIQLLYELKRADLLAKSEDHQYMFDVYVQHEQQIKQKCCSQC